MSFFIQILKIFLDGESTASQSLSEQSTPVLSCSLSEILFHLFPFGIALSSISDRFLLSTQWATLRRILWKPPLRIAAGKIPIVFLFSRLNKPSSLTLSLWLLHKVHDDCDHLSSSLLDLFILQVMWMKKLCIALPSYPLLSKAYVFASWGTPDVIPHSRTGSWASHARSTVTGSTSESSLNLDVLTAQISAECPSTK